MADTADIMADTADIIADTADIIARYRREADTADILARYRREADTADILARYRREADTADILARYRREADTADILARYHREADTRSAEAGRNSAAAHREHIENGAAATGAAVIGAAIGGVIIDPPATDSSLSVDLVIRTTGIGTHFGAGAILTRTRTTAIILIGIILRMGTLMIITIAPYQEGNSFGPDPSCDSRLRTFVRRTENALIANLIVDLSVGYPI
jgi:hypothetical protein